MNAYRLPAPPTHALSLNVASEQHVVFWEARQDVNAVRGSRATHTPDATQEPKTLAVVVP